MESQTPYTGEQRRAEPRYKVSLDAEVKVPLLDTAPTRLSGKAVIEDMSETGARVHIPALDRKKIPVLAQLDGDFSVVYRLPGASRPSYLWGKIVWLELHTTKKVPSARMGLDLHGMLPTERHEHIQYLQTLAH